MERGNVDTDAQRGDDVGTDAQGEDSHPQATGRGQEQIPLPASGGPSPAHTIHLCCVSCGPEVFTQWPRESDTGPKQEAHFSAFPCLEGFPESRVGHGVIALCKSQYRKDSAWSSRKREEGPFLSLPRWLLSVPPTPYSRPLAT